MSFFAISGLLNGIAAIGLALLVYYRAPQNPRHWTYGLFGLTTAIWSFGYFFWQIAESKEFALLCTRLLMAGAIFIPVTYLHHIFALRNEHCEKWNILHVNYVVGGFFLFSNVTPYFIADVAPNRFFLFWPVPGMVFHVFLIWWIGIVIYGHYLLWDAYSKGTGVRRQQYLYLIVATLVGSVGGATNFPLWYGYEVLPYGNILFTFYISLVAYTLLRYHLMDFSVIIEKGLSYLAVLLLISQPAYPVLLLAQKSVFGVISYRYSMVQLFVHLLTVAGAYQMRLGTRRAIADTVLAGQDSDLKTLSKFSTNISSIQDMKLLGKEILDTLSRGMHAKTAMLFVLDGEGKSYLPVSDFGSPYNRSSNYSFAVTDDLPRYLAIVQSRIMRDELQQSFPDQWKQTVIQDLDRLQADACFPFIRKNRLLGFCLLSPCRQDSLEAADVLGFISTLLGEASLALENTLLREEVQRSKSVVRHMDRLRSLETMSAGLARELDHPQASIKAFVQLARMRKNDEAFLKRFQEVISGDVLRIEQLTKEIREYVLDAAPDYQILENLNDLIESCVSFISLNPEYHDVKIETSYLPELPSLECKRQEIRQVIFNLLLYQLNRNSNRVRSILVKTHSISSATSEEWVQIEVLDGHTKQPLDLLVPSSHSENVAIIDLGNSDTFDEGLTIAAEIVQAHDGYIQAYGTGQEPGRFLVSLPVDRKMNAPSTDEVYFPKAITASSRNKITDGP